MSGAAVDLEEIFQRDVERIAENFIQAFDLTFARGDHHLSYAPYRWLEFALLRYVTPTPRQVLLSRGLWRRAAKAPEQVRSAVDNFAHRVRRGEDINAYQGRGLTTNDISGEEQARRTDLLLADFGIHHFHITDKPVVAGEYSRRSGWLLFAVVQEDALLCIDVRHHPKGVGWAQKDVLELAVKNWPKVFASNEARNVTGGDWSDEEIVNLRRGGANTLHRVGSRAYGPINGGLTAAGTPFLVHKAADGILLEIEDLARQFVDANNSAVRLCYDKGIQRPEFHIVLTPDGIAVCEEATRIGAVLSAWPRLSEFAPQWAIARLAAFCVQPVP